MTTAYLTWTDKNGRQSVSEFICADCVTPTDIIEGAFGDPNGNGMLCDRCEVIIGSDEHYQRIVGKS